MRIPSGDLRRLSRNKDYSFGANAFPSSSAGTGKVEKDGLYECKQCGFWNDKALVQSPGSANEGDGGISIVVTSAVGDPTVTDYCAQCGSPNSR